MWVIMDTEVYDAHVFEDIEEKEYEGNLVVESDQHGNPMHVTT